MASFFNCFLFISFVFFFLSSSAARTPSYSKSVVLAVSKDKCLDQYIIQINQRTPPVPVKLAVDLGAGFTWVNCEEGYVSSSYRPASCNSGVCPLVDSVGCSTWCDSSPKPGCYNETCRHFVDNSISDLGMGGEVGQDIASVISFDVKNPGGRIVSLSHFLFVCGSTWLSDHLADGVTGIAGLGRHNFSLPYYFSDSLGLSKNFALCLSPSTNNGLVSFGDGLVIANDLLTYTPLVLNPVNSRAIGGSASSDYYVGVKSISVGGKEIKFNKTLLSIAKEGTGGTMISTVKPYTVLHTSIYKALVKAFLKKLNGGIFTPVVPPVPVPFGACFDTANFISDEEFFSSLPVIDLELESGKGKKLYWRISSANSMVKVTRYRTCLAFVDGGSSSWAPSIIIGGRQLEDILLHFDLANSKLGFSSNLLARNTSCSSFINSNSI